ncbi:MAG: SH3 domain-containing protein [Roseiflexaceae bacterium]|nr:SH3 domain-containing protein [Roseiflexaceae bacterium]
MTLEDDEYETQDERPPHSGRRSSGQTDRLNARQAPEGEPVRSDWLSSRTSARSSGRKRRPGTIPSTREELVLWLQHGGLRTVAIVVAATFAAIVLMVLIVNRANAPTALDLPQPTIAAGFGGSDPQSLPTLDPLAAAATVTPAPQPAVAAQFRVFGTAEQGLFLRADHTTDANVVETLTDGSVVTIVGEDFVGTDRVWKNIQSPGGQQGWAASEFLEQIQP